MKSEQYKEDRLAMKDAVKANKLTDNDEASVPAPDTDSNP